ncbi:MAG: folate family ECF transporter S component [Christensenella sp.]|nr:folate family ECF transporter S component [Christensenella sp.]
MKHITPKRLSLMAMLIALQIVLSKFLMLQLTDSIRLSIDSVPILLGGIWFGPVAGGIIGTLADLLGTILFPTAGAYYPPLTIAFLLIGVVAGLLAKIARVKNALLRMACIVIPAEIVGSYLFKSFALSGLIGLPFSTLLAARILPVGAIMIVNTMLVTLLHRMFGEKATRQSGSQISATPSAVILGSTDRMSYEDAMTYIHHVTWRGSRLGLERTRELLSRIGNPHQRLKFIHIAGTNGKGSTAAMLAKILSLAGYKTGLYISPYINRFNERMQMDGELIADDELAQITAYIRPHAEAMADHPTEFELITVIAFEYFARHAADIVVLEVGLGGELDSTNVIDTPALAVITNIGLDHTRELGPTITDIARAKAGIIKPGGEVVIYDQNVEADAVFAEACRARSAKLIVTDHSRVSNISPALDALRFDCTPYGTLASGLTGVYQAQNAAVVITAVERLQKKGWNISEQNLRDGLLLVRWPARFELLGRNPIFIADGGHNPQGISAVVESLKQHFPNRPITFLIGIMADKDIPHMIDQLAPIAKEFITVTPDNPRAMNAAELAELLLESKLPAVACASVAEGIALAISHAGKSGVVCALGSLYLLGDVRSALGVK